MGAGGADKTTEPPVQKTSELPAVIVAAGNGFTVMLTGADVEPHSAALVNVTVYAPVESAT